MRDMDRLVALVGVYRKGPEATAIMDVFTEDLRISTNNLIERIRTIHATPPFHVVSIRSSKSSGGGAPDKWERAQYDSVQPSELHHGVEQRPSALR